MMWHYSVCIRQNIFSSIWRKRCVGQSLSAAPHYFIIIILFPHIFYLSHFLSRFSHAVWLAKILFFKYACWRSSAETSQINVSVFKLDCLWKFVYDLWSRCEGRSRHQARVFTYFIFSSLWFGYHTQPCCDSDNISALVSSWESFNLQLFPN